MTHPRLRRLHVFVLLALLGASHANSHAADRLPPDGIDGALVLCGGKATEAACARFVELAGKDKAILVIVTNGDKSEREKAEELATSLKERKPAEVVVLAGDAKADAIVEALRKATGVWFADTESKALVARFRQAEVEKELAAVLKRGGVVCATDGAALAQFALDPKTGQPAKSGLALLPGALVDPRIRKEGGEKNLCAALDKTPGVFGVGLADEAVLVIKGRMMALAGDGVGVVCLAKSPAKMARTIELSARTPADLTTCRRCALARAEAPFPPKEAPVPEVTKGSLVIVGGGGMPADVTKKFIDLAGGPDALIVVLPTANPPDPLALATEGSFFKRAGATNVIVLPARKLEDVEDQKYLDVLKKAGGVWFGGGRQWRFVDAYEGTKAHAAFHEVLKRGGVIGGSSAGASIQGDYMCRGNPLGNLDIMCEGYERGLGFLPGTAIDQHFTQRKRFADMTDLVKTYPQLLGIGIDEATAVIVKGHIGEIMGRGEAHFYDRKKPLVKGKPDYESVKAGGRYDLKERKVLEPEKK